MSEYELEASIEWLERYIDSPIFTEEVRQRLYLVTGAAKKYKQLKDALDK